MHIVLRRAIVSLPTGQAVHAVYGGRNSHHRIVGKHGAQRPGVKAFIASYKFSSINCSGAREHPEITALNHDRNSRAAVVRRYIVSDLRAAQYPPALRPSPSISRMTRIYDAYCSSLRDLGFGEPLWEPEPGFRGQVECGDVGYITEGAFVRLFRATCPPDDPVNRFGVPDGFTVLNIPEDIILINNNFIEPQPICSRSVKCSTLSVGPQMCVKLTV